MFTARFRLFRLLGIPISVDASWLIILALLTFSLAHVFPSLLAQFYPHETIALPEYQYWLMGFCTALAFFVCIVLHELGHALVARSRGMSIQGITLFLFGGVAELGDEPESAGTEFLMAIGGPVVSLVLVLFFAILTGVSRQLDFSPPLVIMLGYLAVINGMVLVFNMIPGFPLDGGRVLRSILWASTGNVRKATRWASLIGQGFAWLLIALALVRFFSGQWAGGIWLALIGLFLNRAAQGSYQQVLIREVLQGVPVRRFMNTSPIVVPPSLDLHQWVEDYVYRFHRKVFPVVADGHLEGAISTKSLSQIPRSEWDLHTVGEVMRHDLTALTISADADALEAMKKMRRNGLSRLLVTEGDHLAGIVSLKDLFHFLSLKLELENGSAEEHRAPLGPQQPQRREETMLHR